MIVSNPEDRKRIASAIKELSDSMTRIDAEKDLMKDIIQVTFENHGIDKKHLRKIANVYHKQNLSEVKNEQEEFETLYEQLFKE